MVTIKVAGPSCVSTGGRWVLWVVWAAVVLVAWEAAARVRGWGVGVLCGGVLQVQGPDEANTYRHQEMRAALGAKVRSRRARPARTPVQTAETATHTPRGTVAVMSHPGRPDVSTGACTRSRKLLRIVGFRVVVGSGLSR